MRPIGWLSGAIALATVACACTSLPQREAAAPSLDEALGVHLEGLRLSAAGYMLDLRYRVVDAEKARPLFERKVRPMLVDPASGAEVTVPDTPKLGQLRSTTRNVKVGRTYSILFANPGRVVQKGASLALVAGGARVDGLRVE